MAMPSGESENEGKRIGAAEFAGMPREIRQNAYPKNRGAAHRNLDDTMRGIDDELRRSDSTTMKHLSNQH